MQTIQNLAEFMYLSYSQKLWEDGVRVPYFKKLSDQQKLGWLAAAQTASTFITTRKVVEAPLLYGEYVDSCLKGPAWAKFVESINKTVIIFP